VPQSESHRVERTCSAFIAILRKQLTRSWRVVAFPQVLQSASWSASWSAAVRCGADFQTCVQNAGVKLSDAGVVLVDEHLRTNVPHIWALGDCIGRVELTPVALMEGMAFAASCCGSEMKKPDYGTIPSAVCPSPCAGLLVHQLYPQDVSPAHTPSLAAVFRLELTRSHSDWPDACCRESLKCRAQRGREADQCQRIIVVNCCASSSSCLQVFCQPPLGTVGYTEEECVQRYEGDLEVFVSKFKPMKNTLSGREDKTLMKMIVHKATQRVVGIHMVGPDAAEIMQVLLRVLASPGTRGTLPSRLGRLAFERQNYIILAPPLLLHAPQYGGV
jgi:Pyridine nucleotide-disulphide oxidoreductase, dimerisation domain/Pyridine nucleotide-disulphide oxidoreductase